MRDIKGTFNAKMVTIKDRNGMDLTEAEELARIHKTVQKSLSDPDNHDVVFTHLESDILECEVKWFLGSINYYKQS